MNKTVLDNHRSIISRVPDSLFIFILTIFINAIMAYIVLSFFNVNMFPDYYHIIAQNLLDGSGYVIEPGGDIISFTARYPLYPFFLAALYYIFGLQHIAVVIVHILLNSFTSVFLYQIMKKIYSHPVGMLSAILYALYPLTAYYLVRELPTIFFTFLLALFIIVMYRFYELPSRINSFILGCMIGVLTLTQSFFLGFPFFFIICMFFISALYFYRFIHLKTAKNEIQDKGYIYILFDQLRKYIRQSNGNLKKHLRLSLIMLFGFLMVIMPWIIRNFEITGRFPVFSTAGGYTLWMGNNFHFDGKDYDELSVEKAVELRKAMLSVIGEEPVAVSKDDSDMYGKISEPYKTSETTMNFNRVPRDLDAVGLRKEVNAVGRGVQQHSLENDKKLYNEAIGNMIRYPKETAILMFKKAFRLWFSVFSFKMKKYQLLVTILQALVILPAFYGIILSFKNKIRIGPLIIILLFFQILFTVFTATVRYSIPVMPIIISFAVYGLIESYRKLLLKNKNRIA